MQKENKTLENLMRGRVKIGAGTNNNRGKIVPVSS